MKVPENASLQQQISRISVKTMLYGSLLLFSSLLPLPPPQNPSSLKLNYPPLQLPESPFPH